MDSIVSSNYSTQSLEPSTYWWKVREYNISSGIYGDYSNVSNFYLIRNTSDSGITGIEGIVFEIANGVPIAISGSTVYIHNEALNWSSSQVTGTNGYYLFDNLTNNTVYSIYAIKSLYDVGVPEYITTIPGQRIPKNLLLQKCTSTYTCYYGTIPQKIRFMWANGTLLKGYTVNIYIGETILATATLTTDRDGMVMARLNEGTRYRLEILSNGANLITGDDRYFYPSNEQMEIIIGNITWGEMNATTPTNMTNATIVNGTWNGSLSYYTPAYLTSNAGLGPLAQGVVVSGITWVVAGAGGAVTVIFVTGMLCWLGIVSWNMLFYFIITGISFYVITEMK